MEMFLQKISDFMHQHKICPGSRPALVALSGGADSVALLHVLLQSGFNCIAAHCNFHLREKESDRDEQFVVDLCKRLGVTLHVKSFDVANYIRNHKGVSIEMACRELRYAWFWELMSEHNCKALFTGHHRDDNVETFILNAVRGTGISGLKAMLAVRDAIMRPLLCISRKEIEDFLCEIDEEYVVDYTNNETDFTRNKIRNIILPQLEQQIPGAINGLAHTISDTSKCFALYEELVDNIRKQISVGETPLALDISKLTTFKTWRTLLFEIMKPYGFNSVQVEDLANAINESGKFVLSGSHKAVISRDLIEIFPQNGDVTTEAISIDINDSQSLESASLKITQFDAKGYNISAIDGKRIICFDADKFYNETHGKLILRNAKTGDKMKPFGMSGTRLLSDLFRDLKLTDYEKQHAKVLTDSSGKILWVLNYRSSAHYRIDKNTEKIIEFKII